jgi:hypothetical protein
VDDIVYYILLSSELESLGKAKGFTVFQLGTFSSSETGKELEMEKVRKWHRSGM